MPDINNIKKDKTDWTDIPKIITNPMYFSSKYSHREQKIKLIAKPTAKIKVVNIKKSGSM